MDVLFPGQVEGRFEHAAVCNGQRVCRGKAGFQAFQPGPKTPAGEDITLGKPCLPHAVEQTSPTTGAGRITNPSQEIGDLSDREKVLIGLDLLYEELREDAFELPE